MEHRNIHKTPFLSLLPPPFYLSLPPLEEKVDEIGPLEPDREDIRRDPLSLPEHFVWDDVDLLDDAQVGQCVVQLQPT